MVYEHHTTDDQVAPGFPPAGVGGGPRSPAPVLLQVLQEGLYPPPAPRRPGPQGVPQGRLPRRHRVPARLVRAAGRVGAQETAPLHHPPEGPHAAEKKDLDALLRVTAAPPPRPPAGQPPPAEPVGPVCVAVDATGYDARPVSRYFAARCGRPGGQKRWPKLTAVVDTRTHLFLAASVTHAPRQDAPRLV